MNRLIKRRAANSAWVASIAVAFVACGGAQGTSLGSDSDAAGQSTGAGGNSGSSATGGSEGSGSQGGGTGASSGGAGGGSGSTASGTAGGSGSTSSGTGTTGGSTSGNASGSGSGASGSKRDGGPCAVCDLYCPNGMVVGPNGCPECRCNPGPDASAPDSGKSDAAPHCGVERGACCPNYLNRSQCDNGLTCCVGLPYPTDGVCETACVLRSDYHAKRDFQPVNVDAVLEQVASMSMTTWAYKEDASNVRHMGPIAQEFREAFGLGESELHIHPVDGIGVSLAAIQALNRAVLELRSENRELRAQNAEITGQLRSLRARTESSSCP